METLYTLNLAGVWSAFFSRETLAGEFFGNTVADYLNAAAIFVATFIVLWIVRSVILRSLYRLAEKTKTDVDDMLVQVVKSIRPLFYYFVSFYLAFISLSFHDIAEQVITGILVAWAAYQIIKGFQVVIDYVVEKRTAAQDSRESQQAVRYLGRIGKWLLWILGILMVLANFGVNVTSLVAGLGIGGVAIAIALQSILGDLFSSFAIFFDKPFIVGDFIQVGEHVGTVERIGIKTTRMRALSGEEVVISNAELTSARIHNYGRITERRALHTIGVTYETPVAKLRKIPEIIEGIVNKQEKATFDRAHFKAFGDSALSYELVYYVATTDYNEFMDIQQAVNIAIVEAFQNEGIAFAYPTQTVYLNK